jgi:hypothetical protein
VSDIIEILKEFGLPVAFLGLTCWAYWQTQKDHKQERVEWREDSKRMHRNSNEVLGKTSEALVDLTVAIKLNNEMNRDHRLK